MKLDLLFSQFLYQHKKLVLPGIGTFLLDPSAAIPDATDRQKAEVTGITYDQKSVQQIDETLIEFVRAQTGKIRPLAISDIESFISLNSQLLNIGNPLYIDGIGTLIKSKDGRLNFTPGVYAAVRMEDMNVGQENTEFKARVTRDSDYSRYESQTNNMRKLLIVAAALITLGIIGGGAYYLYQSNAHKKTAETEVTDTLARQVETDTTHNASSAYMPDSNLVRKDSALAKLKQDSIAAPAAAGTSTLKYVLEITNNKARALKRYAQLTEFGNKVQMETKDSASFKLYFLIPSALADTAHVKDSLTRYFGRAVWIEKQ